MYHMNNYYHYHDHHHLLSLLLLRHPKTGVFSWCPLRRVLIQWEQYFCAVSQLWSCFCVLRSVLCLQFSGSLRAGQCFFRRPAIFMESHLLLSFLSFSLGSTTTIRGILYYIMYKNRAFFSMCILGIFFLSFALASVEVSLPSFYLFMDLWQFVFT